MCRRRRNRRLMNWHGCRRLSVNRYRRSRFTKRGRLDNWHPDGRWRSDGRWGNWRHDCRRLGNRCRANRRRCRLRKNLRELPHGSITGGRRFACRGGSARSIKPAPQHVHPGYKLRHDSESERGGRGIQHPAAIGARQARQLHPQHLDIMRVGRVGEVHQYDAAGRELEGAMGAEAAIDRNAFEQSVSGAEVVAHGSVTER